MERFVLKFLWLDKSIGVSLDQKVGDKTTPLTEFFFWPQKDAWEEMKFYLESKSWILQTESIYLLNQITEVINFWQEKDGVSKKDLNKIKEQFPDTIFVGYE
uniref:Small ribosomal subunit protein cS23 n=1 Tax=Monomorphina parapyrum TaxID=1664066 RepID=A0A0G3VIF9_9EUGL|nr:putative ribosomal protein 3 [Monomorphina parapyrum]AKL78968.1 putative ribosomal protein 3 [Monomorphina parapyrum]